MTGKDRSGDRILDYLSGALSAPEERQLERDLLAERHLALFDGAAGTAGGEVDRRLLERHASDLEALLGEEGGDAADLALLSPDELRERALAAEAELLDGYVRGRLGGAERTWIEHLARASGRVRDRLATAVALRDLEIPQAASRPTGPVPHRPWRWARLAVAAMLALAVSVGLFRWGSVRPDGPTVAVSATIELAATSRAGEIASRILPPGLTSLTVLLRVPAGSGAVFDVAVRSPEGREIFRRAGLRPVAGGDTLAFTWNPDKLPEGVYTVAYQGHSEDGKAVDGGEVEIDLRYPVRPR